MEPRERIRTYRELRDPERFLLQLLAVHYRPVGITALTEGLNRCGLRMESGASFTLNAVKPHLESLVATGLVLCDESRFRTDPDAVEWVTRETVQEGRFETIAASVMSHVQWTPVREGATFHYRFYDELIRDFRLDLYSGDPVKAQERLERCRKSFDDDMERDPPWARVAMDPFDPEWMDALPHTLRIDALREILDVAARRLQAIPDVLTTLEQRTQEPTEENAPLRLLLAEHRMMRGELVRARSLIADIATPRALSLKAWHGLLSGNAGVAAETYRQALEEARKGRKKVVLDSLADIFQVVALLGLETREATERARALLVGKDGVALTALPGAHGDLLRLIAFLSGITEPETRERAAFGVNEHPLEQLLGFMTKYWIDPSMLAGSVPLIARLSEKAFTGGYRWIAFECLELMSRVTSDEVARETHRSLAISLRFSTGGASLLDRIRRQEPWEGALDALTRLGAPEESAGSAPSSVEERLLWLLFDDAEGVRVEPMLQKRTNGGPWTKGRALALKHLMPGPTRPAYLTHEDAPLCEAILERRESKWFGRHQRTVHELDLDRALPGLVGHPRVFRGDDPEARLEILEGSPELSVRREGEGGDLRVELIPRPPEEGHVTVVPVTRYRYQVVSFTAAHRKVGSIVGAGLVVPLKARERLVAALSAIAPLLTIHSEIGIESSEVVTLEADPRPVAQLSPLGDGLRVKLLVRPLGDRGPVLPAAEGGRELITEVDGRKVRVRRDMVAETTRLRRVLDACPVLEGYPEDGSEWRVPVAGDALEVLSALHTMGAEVVLEWPRGGGRRVVRQATLQDMNLTITKHRDWFAVDGSLAVDEGRVLGLKQLVEGLEKGAGRFVALGPEEFLALSEDLRRRLEEVRDFSHMGKDGLEVHPLAAVAMREFLEGAGSLEAAREWREHVDRVERPGPPAEVPTTVMAELRSYQVEGFQWMDRLARMGFGACLADDMGLGKTLQTLTLLVHRAAGGPALVIAPTSVCFNWEEEARRFAPTLTVHTLRGTERRKVLRSLGKFDVLVTSYGLLQQEADLLASYRWHTVVLDEAQAIKNATTRRSKAAMDLEADFKLLTTGTPVENRLAELWNLFRFINPGLLGSLDRFNARFAVPIEKEQDRGARSRLRKLVSPFILRRTKSQVLDELPPRTEILLKVELDEGERAFYEALRKRAVERLEEHEETRAGEKQLLVLSEILKLRQACCHPKLVDPGSPLDSSKLRAFVELVEELRANHHKALVFSQFVSHLALLRQPLDQAGVKYQYLDGSTPLEERRAAVEAFQAGDGELFLISLKAGGVGLNLTAADYVIHMDPWWNPAVEDQASDRAHRIGQTRPVTVYRLVARDTIEERIVALHLEKRDLADALLAGTERPAGLAADELVALIRGR